MNLAIHYKKNGKYTHVSLTLPAVRKSVLITPPKGAPPIRITRTLKSVYVININPSNNVRFRASFGSFVLAVRAVQKFFDVMKVD